MKRIHFRLLNEAFALDQQIATIETTDGVCRPVYEEAGGRQYFIDDGLKVYGVWFIPHDESELTVTDF